MQHSGHGHYAVQQSRLKRHPRTVPTREHAAKWCLRKLKCCAYMVVMGCVFDGSWVDGAVLELELGSHGSGRERCGDDSGAGSVVRTVAMYDSL